MTTRIPVSISPLRWRLDYVTCLDVSALAEFQVARTLVGDDGRHGHGYVFRGPEGGNNDLGLLVSEEGPHDLDKDSTSRFIQLKNINLSSKNIAPLDIKSLTAGTSHGTAFWRVCLTPQQVKTCQAVIITNPKEPKFVVVLPVQYLHGMEKTSHPTKGTYYYFTGPRPLWTLHPLPAFPPTLTPFVLPLTGLHKAIDDMRDFATASVKEWVNDYTGAHFTRVLRPTVYGLTVLEPRFPSFRRAYDEILSLHRAFNQYSQSFRISFCDIRSMLGDFKLTNSLIREHSHVEAKTGHCIIRRAGSPTLSHTQRSIASPTKRIFTWRAEWDYLYSHVDDDDRSQPPQALFVPRDKIPKIWWNVPLVEDQDDRVWLDWPADDPDGFDGFLVNTAPAGRLVHDLEEILRTNPTNAQNPVSMATVALADLTESTTEPEDIQPSLSEAHWDSSAFQRGYGSADHAELKGETYSLWASEVLLELCREKGKAVVLDLGLMEPMPRYWLACYNWSDADKDRYDRDKEPPCPVWCLDPLTPIVPIRFLRLAWNHGFEPWCVRSSVFTTRAMANQPCLIVCDLFPNACMRLPHGRFILPSEILLAVSYRKNFTLEGGLLEQYSVDYDDVVGSILSVLDGKSETSIGLCNRIIQTSTYVCRLGEKWQAITTNLPVKPKHEDAVTEAEEDNGTGAEEEEEDEGTMTEEEEEDEEDVWDSENNSSASD